MDNHGNNISTRGLSSVEEQRYSQLGKTLVNQIAIMIRTARMHSSDNKLFRAHIDQTHKTIVDACSECGELSLQLQSGYLFFCGARIKYDAEGQTSARFLIDLLDRIGTSGIVFLNDSSIGELEKAIIAINTFDADNLSGFEKLQQYFDAEGIESIELAPPLVDAAKDENSEKEKRFFARKTFFYAINNLKSVTNLITTNKPVDFSRTRRVINSLVDQILSDESYLLELTALKSHDQYTFLHSTNVCIYAICLGSRLKMNRTELSMLGFSALFHDIGKTKLPVQILNKPTEFTESDWELMRKHPIYGVMAIAKTMPFDERSCRAILVAFEHHYNLDGSGYPLVKFRRPINLYSKIVSICDVFDAMSSGRVYRKNPVSPDQALKTMTHQAGLKFEPLLLKVFVNAVSLYPPGTLLLLDTGERAVVIGKNPEDLLRPKVKLIGRGDEFFEKAIRADLTERDPATLSFLRSISRVLDPKEVPVNLSRYIIEDD